MAQQTAVEWIAEKMEKLTPPGYKIAISIMLDKAKQMEKEQIIKAYNQDLYGGLSGDKKFDDGEQYYNLTFGK